MIEIQSSTKQKILVVGSTQGVFGGIEVFMLALGEYLNSLPGVQCRVVFKLVKGFPLKPSLVELIDQSDIDAEVVNRGTTRLFQHLYWADVIHTQNFPPDVLIPAFLLGKTVVSTQHNWKRNHFNAHQVLWNVTRRLIDFTTYNSRFVARTWEEGKISTARSGVIPTISRFPEALPDYTVPRKGFCFISRWIEGKGVELLIKAYAKTTFDREQHPLRMMGSGPMLSSIKQQQETTPIDGLHIMGRVEENTKFEVIRSSRWMVTPPECFEDMGLTPIEGRMLGVPTVASNIGGIPESAGPFALFFESGDVEALTQQLETAARMKPDEYKKRSEGCYQSLKTYLKPLKIYPELYNRYNDRPLAV